MTPELIGPANVAGRDRQGANSRIVVVRTDPDKGGTEGLSAIMVERGKAGISYKLISKADPSFNPRALMDDEYVEFTKDMERIDTVPAPEQEVPQLAPVG